MKPFVLALSPIPRCFGGTIPPLVGLGMDIPKSELEPLQIRLQNAPQDAWPDIILKELDPELHDRRRNQGR
jgi:hypothetical protein